MQKSQRKKEVLLRLKRIEGQIRGLERMVEQELPCPDILTQVAAVTAAIKRAGMAIMEAYMEECLEKSRQEPSKTADTLRQFQRAMSSYIDWS